MNISLSRVALYGIYPACILALAALGLARLLH